VTSARRYLVFEQKVTSFVRESYLFKAKQVTFCDLFKAVDSFFNKPEQMQSKFNHWSQLKAKPYLLSFLLTNNVEVKQPA
jgi:hypothetical protein